MSAWIPLMDYAIKKGVSISTLRRYIKSNKIKYRTEAGKYLLWDDEASARFLTGADANPIADGPSVNAPRNGSFGRTESLFRSDLFSAPEGSLTARANAEADERVRHLEDSLRKAQEEISELKMLVSIYEDQLQSKNRAL